MLSTAFPQLFHIASIIGLLTAIGGFIYLRIKYLRDFPGRAKINALSLEVAELAQATEALNDRFTRFQKREGMRDARSAKERERDILAQAQQIAAEAGSADDSGGDKLALYRRLNH